MLKCSIYNFSFMLLYCDFASCCAKNIKSRKGVFVKFKVLEKLR